MPITKKFGDTRATSERRILTLKPKRDTSEDVEQFLLNNPDAVIGQWASAMDKIASKPKGNGKPTKYQRAFRQRLGDAIWQDLTSPAGPLHSAGEDLQNTLKAKWERRMHPYEKGISSPKNPPTARGRQYERFAGETGTGNANVQKIAIKIRYHMLSQEFKKHDDMRDAGRATRRASSIAKNTLKRADMRRRKEFDRRASFSDGCEWDAYGIAEYCDLGDPVKEIYDAACELEKNDRRVSWRMAAEVLFEHYGRVFQDNDKVMSFSQAEMKFPDLIALHRAIERYYRELLKRHKKDKPNHKVEFGTADGQRSVEAVNRRRNVSLLMPKSTKEIEGKLQVRQKNKDVMALIRRGRILHYQLGRVSNTDRVDAVLESQNWSGALDDDYYWSTEGQIEIKRAESFVRVWRNFVAHGARTLTDWIRPVVEAEEEEMDVTYEFPDKLTFLDERAEARTPILFGARAGLLGEGEDLLETIRVLGSMFTEIRHNSFHFRGMDGFVGPLIGKSAEWDKGALARLRKLYDADRASCHKRLQADLRGAQAEHFLDPTRLGKIWSAIQGLSGSETTGGRPTALVTLPRFTRVVKRNANAWGDRNRHVPAPVNKVDMKEPHRHFHYITTKLLYTRGFRQWIAEADAAAINGWIQAACDRAQKATYDFTKDELAVAKMIGQIEIPEGENIRRFFDDLVGLTATEFRVQKGYESDGEAAKKQAAFLENLNCDVMAQAFDTYLHNEGFGWLKDLAQPENFQTQAISNLEEFQAVGGFRVANEWEVALYGVLHLVPVGEVAKLQHQLRRWGNKRGQEVSADELQAALEDLFTQYLDSHDEKFEGGDALRDSCYISQLFGGNNANLVRDKILPTLKIQGGAQQHERVPLRQLREMFRFGNLRAIRPFCENVPITWEMCQALEKLESNTAGNSQIESAQAARTKHHDLLCKEDLEGDGSLEDYVEALRTVITHRRLSNHVNFVNHVRFNGLMMSVLGRLADIAGIWERDFYFCMLALIQQENEVPSSVFEERGQMELRNARIVKAARNLKKKGSGQKIRDELKSVFKVNSKMERGIVAVRNRFAHFSPLLTKANEEVSLFDITTLLNDARDLLAYDRKMKNAVVPSINTIFERANIEVFWQMASHKLSKPLVKSKVIEHLKDRKINQPQENVQLKENLTDATFLLMVANLVGGEVAPEIADVVSY